jgi:hypothetical protein
MAIRSVVHRRQHRRRRSERGASAATLDDDALPVIGNDGGPATQCVASTPGTLIHDYAADGRQPAADWAGLRLPTAPKAFSQTLSLDGRLTTTRPRTASRWTW